MTGWTSPTHIVLLLLIALLLFGARRLPEIGRSLGSGMREFKDSVSVYAGFLLALPVILWQLWSFLAPAFAPSVERRVLGLVAFATALGAAGLAFGYWILLPRAVHWLTHYDDKHFTQLIQAKPYYA